MLVEGCCEALRIRHILNRESNDIDVHNCGIWRHELAKFDEERKLKMSLQKICNSLIQCLVEGVTVKHAILQQGCSTNETWLFVP